VPRILIAEDRESMRSAETGTCQILSEGSSLWHCPRCGAAMIVFLQSFDRSQGRQNSEADGKQPGHDCSLMYVQSTTVFDQSLHSASIGGECCAAGLEQTLSCVLPVSGCDKR